MPPRVGLDSVLLVRASLALGREVSVRFWAGGERGVRVQGKRHHWLGRHTSSAVGLYSKQAQQGDRFKPVQSLLSWYATTEHEEVSATSSVVPKHAQSWSNWAIEVPRTSHPLSKFHFLPVAGRASWLSSPFILTYKQRVESCSCR
jgi:hypothetical protein